MFAPETDVRFLANVDFDINGTNVKDFNTRENETNYYINKTKFYFPNCRVMDVEGYSGFIVAPIDETRTIDSYYNCNYLMYRNKELSNKWFYASLGTPQPVNSSCCKIPYSVDLWRTWFMDCKINQCFVEREHVNDDTVGKWVEVENIDTGEYITISDVDNLKSGVNGYDILSPFYTSGQTIKSCIVLPYTVKPETDTSTEGVYTIYSKDNAFTWKLPGMAPKFVGGSLVNGIYQGIQFLPFPLTPGQETQTVTLINDTIKNLTKDGQVDRVMQPFMAPFWMFEDMIPKPGEDLFKLNPNTTKPKTAKLPIKNCPDTIDGYVPKNNKLFTQQFNFFVVDNGMGGNEEFGWEYFKKDTDGSTNFEVYSQITQDPKLRLAPIGYKTTEKETINHQYSLELSGFPKGSFALNRFANDWNAQRNERAQSVFRDDFNYMTSGITGAISAGISSAVSSGVGSSLPIIGAIQNSSNEILNQQLQRERAVDASRIPNITRGVANGSIAFSVGLLTFTQYRMQVRKEYAERIDNFLSMFGYNMNRIKTPNVKGRRAWNYVKTSNASVSGNVPQEAMLKITAMLNGGVRLWHEGSTWLDYSQDNSIVKKG